MMRGSSRLPAEEREDGGLTMLMPQTLDTRTVLMATPQTERTVPQKKAFPGVNWGRRRYPLTMGDSYWAWAILRRRISSAQVACLEGAWAISRAAFTSQMFASPLAHLRRGHRKLP